MERCQWREEDSLAAALLIFLAAAAGARVVAAHLFLLTLLGLGVAVAAGPESRVYNGSGGNRELNPGTIMMRSF
jgi:hypothetical protein